MTNSSGNSNTIGLVLIALIAIIFYIRTWAWFNFSSMKGSFIMSIYNELFLILKKNKQAHKKPFPMKGPLILKYSCYEGESI